MVGRGRPLSQVTWSKLIWNRCFTALLGRNWPEKGFFYILPFKRKLSYVGGPCCGIFLMASAGRVLLFWPDCKQRRLGRWCWNNHVRRMEKKRRTDVDYCTIFSRRSANALGQVVSGSGLIKTFFLCHWTFTSHFVTECWHEFAHLHLARSERERECVY